MRKRPSSVENVSATRNPSGTPHFGAMLEERRKIEEEKLRKEEESRNAKLIIRPKIENEAKNLFLM